MITMACTYIYIRMFDYSSSLIAYHHIHTMLMKDLVASLEVLNKSPPFVRLEEEQTQVNGTRARDEVYCILPYIALCRWH